MAHLMNDETGEKVEVEENDRESTVIAAEDLGVPIACTDGMCGSCKVEVTEGMENLSDLTQKEKDLGIDEMPGSRLLCQCKLKKGLVKVRFESYF